MARIDVVAQRRHRRRNVAQALALLGGMVLILGLCGWLLAGRAGLLTVGVVTAITLAMRPRVPAGWLLRLYGARPLPRVVAPDLHRLVDALAHRAGLAHPPRLYYVPTAMLNAFAVGGRDDAAIGLTDGLLRTLTGRELAGVLAHEIAHIRSDDLWIMTLADSMGRVTHALAYLGLLLMIFALPLVMTDTGAPETVLLVAAVLAAVPTVVTLLQLGLSRSREYDADLEAARLTGDAEGMAGALLTLERGEGRIWERILVPHRHTPDPLLLRTHPPTAERVRRLRSLVPAEQPPLGVRAGPYPPAGQARVTRPARLHYPGIWW